MANIITAGNSTNGGTSVTTDTSGTLNIVTGSGSGSNAITIDASQAVVMPGTLAVTGAQTIGGNLTVTGTLTASGGVSGSITSGTAVSASGTSVDFTSLPTGIKRITVMFSGVSTSGSSGLLIQIGAGSVTTSGYISTGNSFSQANATTGTSSTAGFVVSGPGATGTASGQITISTLGSNVWVSSHCFKISTTNINVGGGNITLSGTLDRVRITTVNGTDSYDAGTINILYE